MRKVKESYHHGDLQQSLVQGATDMLIEFGIENLSLRKLAERVGVSRTAPYHHFKDKNDLLCAIAANGFDTLMKSVKSITEQQSLTNEQKFREFVHGYVNYAVDNPQIYELMFGRTIWKAQGENDSLKAAAYPSFQFQVQVIKLWQNQGLLPQKLNSLRLAQVTWATLHGIARLVIDGIYADASHVDEMCECAVALFLEQPLN
jgi:AcrR family transcriptional regulator